MELTPRHRSWGLETYCHKCELTMDRDENGAINILYRALSALGLMMPAQGGFVDRQLVKGETLEVECDEYGDNLCFLSACEVLH